MKRNMILTHELVEYIPDDIKEGTIYISMAFATVVHKCCCGCGQEVVTPLSPTDWQLIFDGQSISLYPSIGNWSFACQSHYWIEHNRVKWAPRWSQEKIRAGRARNSLMKKKHFEGTTASTTHDMVKGVKEPEMSITKEYFWRKMKNWLFHRHV